MLKKNNGARAKRRQHFYNQRRYAEEVIKFAWDTTPDDVKELATKYADHLKACSCDMCCNPRHSEHGTMKDRLTIQERKSDIDFNEQIDETLEQGTILYLCYYTPTQPLLENTNGRTMPKIVKVDVDYHFWSAELTDEQYRLYCDDPDKTSLK